jgi:GxxExxY protein
MTENVLAKEVVDAAFKVHTALGPGLLESVYSVVLTYELQKRGLDVSREQPIPVAYESLILDEGFRADLIVGNKVILELKSLEKLAPVHLSALAPWRELSPDTWARGQAQPSLRRKVPAEALHLGALAPWRELSPDTWARGQAQPSVQVALVGEETSAGARPNQTNGDQRKTPLL